MSNYRQEIIKSVNCTKIIFLEIVPVIDLHPGNLEMTNLHTDEMGFSHNLTKIGTDENKAIYSIWDLEKSKMLIQIHFPHLSGCALYSVCPGSDGWTDRHLLNTHPNQSEHLAD